MVWVERRGSALIQDRLGPNRVGPLGLFQPIVDVVKLLTKEVITPAGVRPLLYILAPAIAVVVALSTFIAIPIGKDSGLELFGHAVNGFIVAPDLNIGLLYVFAMASFGVYPLLLAGWSSDNKYALIGGVRASAQAISYEIAMIISIVGVLMSSGTLRLQPIVDAQSGVWMGFLPNWNVFPQPIGAIIFMVAVFASKVAMLLWFFVWVRWTLPRFRYDQLMALGWKVMVPLAVLNFLWVGVAMALGYM
ncbi:MAG: NADH-quinone oxidoreductase subunit H [Acidobacteria bacterium]|nr:NADH-quinone oxidoreductase subunit H [Candidatus Sulfomarinibacter sp. MAG AM1]